MGSLADVHPAFVAQQAPQGAQTVLIILGLGLLFGLIFYVYFVARWIYRDAKQRGHNATLWCVLFVVLSFPGWMILGVVVIIVYLSIRAPQKKYDESGQLIVPTFPPPPLASRPAEPTMSPPGAIPVTSQPTPMAAAPVAGAPMAFASPSGPLSKVRCPYCRTVFEYQKALEGKTHVKCPACGQEGNI